MNIKTVSEVEDIYMNINQSLTCDGQFNRSFVERIDNDVEFLFDESQGRSSFKCTFPNYTAFGFVDSNIVLLTCKRRYKNSCIEDFKERIK